MKPLPEFELSLSEKRADWPGFFPYEGEKEKENAFAAPSVEDQSADESYSLGEDLFAQKSEAQNDRGNVGILREGLRKLNCDARWRAKNFVR